MRLVRTTALYRTLGVVLLGGLGLCGPVSGFSQPASDMPEPAVWELVMAGTAASWPTAPPSAPVDSVRAVAASLLQALQQDGFYYARIDSAAIDTARRPPRVRLYAHRGPRIRLDTLRIRGAEAVPPERLRATAETRPGRPLNGLTLERDLEAMLSLYESEGYPLAQIQVADVTLRRGPAPGLAVTLQVEEGRRLWLKGVALPPNTRTRPGFAASRVGLRTGAPLTDYDPAAIQRALRETGLFQSVGVPELRVEDDGGATVFVPVEEAPPGSFDLVLGYLPPSGTRGGQLVGSGELFLENLFGGGRTGDLTLDRRPGQASLFDVSAADPYVLGLPLRVEGRFRGEQRDSTFGKRAYRGEVGYRLTGGLELRGSVSREVVRPGQAGGQLQGREQAVPRAQALFYGLGAAYRQLDDPRTPRSGGWIAVDLEQGRKDRRFRRVTPDGDTLRVRQSLRQERITGGARLFLPLFDRQGVVLGGDASVLVSDAYDQSDLFRIGGAQSLRGYDEDRFLGNVTVRALAEYRLQIDRVSYAFAFFDLGYVERPELNATPARSGWHPGYGLGIQAGTALGVVTLTYALQPADGTPANGRVHVGLGFNL